MNFNKNSFLIQVSIAFGMGGYILFGFLACLQVDRSSLQREQRSVELLLQHHLETATDNVLRTAYWDDAALHAQRRDTTWFEHEVSQWMHEFFGHDEQVVLDPSGRPWFYASAGHAGHPRKLEVFTHLESTLRQQLTLLSPNDPDLEAKRATYSASEIARLNGQLSIISAAPIVPSTPSVSVPLGQEHLLISVKYLDDEFIEDIRSETIVRDLRWTGELRDQDPSAIVPLVDNKPELGGIAWSPEKPGTKLFWDVLPLALALFFVIIGTIALLLRGLARTMRDWEKSEQRASFQALHDRHTRLLNGDGFTQHAQEQLQLGKDATLFYIDIARFKEINDSLGYAIGNAVVKRVAARLRALGERWDAPVARVGGSEFALLRAGELDSDGAKECADQIMSSICEPFRLGCELITLDARISSAAASDAGFNHQELFRKTGVAMQHLKNSGKNGFIRFVDNMDREVRMRRTIEADLRKSLKTGEGLSVVYQPLYSTDGVMTGAEALLRWQHPTLGKISPLKVVDVAERTGLIAPLGEWVLEQACQTAVSSQIPWIAVNVSAVQLRDPRFADRFLKCIEGYGLSTARIHLEITETTIIDDAEQAISALSDLRRAGVVIALDDFGVGYSNMSYLASYPVDRLKIDRSFIRPLPDDVEAGKIVKALIEMADAVGLSVTAEGIETQEQYDFLRKLKCDEMQGYLFSRPVDRATLVTANAAIFSR